MSTSAFLILLFIGSVTGGPAGYGICQAGCGALVVACYAAGGAVFGTVTAGLGTPAAIVACTVRSEFAKGLAGPRSLHRLRDKDTPRNYDRILRDGSFKQIF